MKTTSLCFLKDALTVVLLVSSTTALWEESVLPYADKGVEDSEPTFHNGLPVEVSEGRKPGPDGSVSGNLQDVNRLYLPELERHVGDTTDGAADLSADPAASSAPDAAVGPIPGAAADPTADSALDFAVDAAMVLEHAELVTETAGESEAVTAGKSEAETAGESDAETAGESEAVTAGKSEAVTAGESEAEAAGESEAVTAGGSEAVTAGKSEAETASESEAVTASESEAVSEDDRQNATVASGSLTTVLSENSTANATAKRCNCLPLNRTQSQLTVSLVNASTLTDLLVSADSVRSRSRPAHCHLVLFYGGSCPFSAAAAPHFNAVPRAFPDLDCVAIDALESDGLNTRFGIIAVPTVILFHNGRPQERLNQSEPTLQLLADFVSLQTQLTPAAVLNVTSLDFSGPLPSAPLQRLDWYLVAAWLFIAACAAYAGTRLRLWRRATDNLRNWWIEAEQHLHEE